MRAAVVVVGDIGHSPRMVLHAQCLAAAGIDVDLLGYVESELPQSLSTGGGRVRVHALGGARAHRVASLPPSRRPRMVGRGFALLFQLAVRLMWRLPRPDCILVQNPPGVPALLVGWAAARMRSARLVVDWHNLTGAMLALRLGAGHPLVKVVGVYEAFFGRRADLNLFVSSAMADTLGRRWGIHGVVFRDRPAVWFRPLSLDDRSRVRAELFAHLGLSSTDSIGLIVSPTSWSLDENLQLLLDAARQYDEVAAARALRGLAVLITGKGPMRHVYEERIASMRLSRVSLHTAWFAPEKYQAVLAAADLGVCLHTSASGLDLPMKVLDLFGANVPVCAFDYGECVRELVHPGVNGLLFQTSHQLCDQLVLLLAGDSAQLETLRRGAAASARSTWEEAWTAEVKPLL